MTGFVAMESFDVLTVQSSNLVCYCSVISFGTTAITEAIYFSAMKTINVYDGIRSDIGVIEFWYHCK